MLKSFFQSLALCAMAGIAATTSQSLVDFDTMCGLVAGDKSIVGFSFDGGSKVVSDGSIAMATLSLSEEHWENPPASVAISAPGITCGRSNFTFDASDPTTFDQSVPCRTDGGNVAPGKDGSLVDVAMIFNYETMSMDAALKVVMQTTCEKMLLQRELADSGHGGGVGDPHLTTFDRVNYDFQRAGVFRLFQSRNLLVQIFQEKCAPTFWRGEASPSCYQGVAVSFAGSVAKLFIENGKIQVGKGTSSLEWLSVHKNKGKTDSYRVFVAADSGTYVDVSLGVWTNKYPFLNIAVQASPYFRDSSVQGLLGNWNGNPRDDLRDNTKLAALHGFPLDDNLFTCTDMSCDPFLQPASLKDDMARALPNDMKMLHQSYAVVDPTEIPLRAFNPVLVPFVKKRSLRGTGVQQVHPSCGGGEETTTPSPSESASESTSASEGEFPTETLHVDVTQRANELCNRVIDQLPTCDKYVGNRAFYIDTVCVGDAVMLGDLSVVESTKLNYMRECRRVLDSRIDGNTSSISEMQTLLNDRKALAFGDLAICTDNCSNQGACLAAGCQCNPGFTGIACEISYQLPIQQQTAAVAPLES